MYANKENVNILTALLVKHGIKMVVVCPGSRNAPLVHNFHECPEITCYPTTDERSAGFYAIGMSQATCAPVAVCVTSGTAVLNLAPAVAEAFYQHIPLVVLTADRPAAWIDQLDGQTLPQPDAFGHFVKRVVSLPEPKDATERWHCNRLVNEALLAVRRQGGAPVHINIPITEPLFDFSVPSLPDERKISRLGTPALRVEDRQALCKAFFTARRPMIVLGQSTPHAFSKDFFSRFKDFAVVLGEALSSIGKASNFDEVLHTIGRNADYMPDFVLYAGSTLVGKRLKSFLRSVTSAEQWLISEDGEVHDTFMHLTTMIEANPVNVLAMLARRCDEQTSEASAETTLNQQEDALMFRHRWLVALQKATQHVAAYTPPYSQMAAVKCFEQQLTRLQQPFHVHYANSTAIRLANIYATHHVWCNRGVNGIEGSLSTASGMSTVTDDLVFCIIGDLSFFYDVNALWNRNLKGNFRILLLNNGGGGIFRQLKGLAASEARNELIAAEHHTEAQGICLQNNVVYLSARNTEEMERGIDHLMVSDADHPLLLEVFTTPEADEKALKEYYNRQKIEKKQE